jgi:hypothetical protein
VKSDRVGVPGIDSSALPDPKHVFLDASAVMRRYGWGKTRGYQNLKDQTQVPPPAVTHPDRWRLDQLMMWEERRVASVELAGAEPRREDLADLLPPSKRPRRRSA